MNETINFNNLNYVIFKQNRENQFIDEINGYKYIRRKAIIKFKNGNINVFYAGFLVIHQDTGKMIFDNPVMRCMNKPSDEMILWVNN